ncbi:MAG: hypothetical protein WC593_09500 [Methanoregula sp.]
MISNDQPGLLEQIKSAVQPLTETGEFDLDSITVNEWESWIIIKLASPSFTIFFSKNALHTGIGGWFINNSGKIFSMSEDTVPILDLQGAGLEGERLEKFPLPEPGTFDSSTKYQAGWDAIMSKTDFFGKLYHLCIGIRDNLPEIRRAITRENIRTG